MTCPLCDRLLSRRIKTFRTPDHVSWLGVFFSGPICPDAYLAPSHLAGLLKQKLGTESHCANNRGGHGVPSSRMGDYHYAVFAGRGRPPRSGAPSTSGGPMTFRLHQAEYDNHTKRAYVEFRRTDGDGGDQLVVA